MSEATMVSKARRYLIIGGGVASIAAIEAIRSLDSQGEIVVVSDDPHGYYSRPGLAYYLTGEVEEQYLYPLQKGDFQRLNIGWVQARADRIDPRERRVFLANGRSLSYDRLLLSIGSAAVIPEINGIDLQGVVKLDHLEDARHILRLARRSRKAVVVGGGITALEIVEGLLANKLEVHYFLRGERYWGNVLDERESLIVEQRLKDEGVYIHYNTELQAVMGKNGRLTAVKSKDGQVLATDILAVAIGVQPRLDLAKRSGLEVGKGIRVDEGMRTSAEDVFAAGDVAEVIDANGKSIMNSLWWPAREQGKIAGINMAGSSARYRRAPAFNVTRLAGLTTTIIGSVGSGRDADLIGIARGDSETWRQIPDAIVAQNNFDVNRLRLLVGDHSLAGAVVMGDQTLSKPLQVLVSKKADVTPIRDLLLHQQDELGDVIAEFWAYWRQNGAT